MPSFKYFGKIKNGLNFGCDLRWIISECDANLMMRHLFMKYGGREQFNKKLNKTERRTHKLNEGSNRFVRMHSVR